MSGWLFPVDDVAALAELLRTRVSRPSAEAMHPAVERVRSELSWKRFADALLDPAGDPATARG